LANFKDIVVAVVSQIRGILKYSLIIKHLTEMIEYAVGTIHDVGEEDMELGFLQAIFENYDDTSMV